jgi:hypothetical protein
LYYNPSTDTLVVGTLSGTATNCSREIKTGSGMNFTGGQLNVDRTITLGTPSSITSSSTDSVTTSSHTHLLADNAVTQDKINAGAVSRGKIADGAVNDLKLAVDAVITSKINKGAVTELKIADNAVTQDKINAGAVSRGKIADGAIDDAKLAVNAVTRAKLANISDNNVLGRLNEGSSGTVQEVTVRTSVRGASNAANNPLVTEKAVRDAISDATSGAGVGTVGSYAFLVIDNRQDTNPGQTRSGSNLYYINANANSATSYPVGSGTWRCMGQARGGTTRGEGYATVWLRIS